ncbi:MAG: class I SAM-dependent DNA methyltransferase, partial [Victivallales bacterium]|nr:class I SAM-dependent DNA methyltransferase [Victivallales bacterium]
MSTDKQSAKEFVAFWTGKGYEKGQTQPFWLWLLQLLGVEHPATAIEFEDKANIDHAHGFIDGYIPATHVLVEQKSLGKSLTAGIPQSDGTVLSPFQQAKRYAVDLPYSRRPRWVVTCNFAEFLIYDMERPDAEPESLLLAELPDQLHRLRFLVDTTAEAIRREEEISKRAGDVVGLIYDALLKQYHDPTSPDTHKSLNELCVRLVFLLYAEDADLFSHLQFHDYLKRFEARDARLALRELFKVLDTPLDKRDPYLSPDLAAFPYVNGGLFANANLEIPLLNDEILDLILRKGSEEFDWKDISPTIFGAVFESTLNPETRRSGGMHYTSVANIHKVIDPLFLDALRAELSEVVSGQWIVVSGQSSKKPPTNSSLTTNHYPLTTSIKARLRAFIERLASLIFLDPACGSGNFLTETYISLRRLENEALSLIIGNQGVLDLEGDMVRVSLSQFHGIEINDFACRVAQTALWIAENQMLRETERIAHRNLNPLPLKSYDGIVEGNALRVDWGGIREQGMVDGDTNHYPLTTNHFSYIIGNPPFVGYSLQSEEQKADILALYRDEKGRPYKTAGKVDYVAGWYWKAAEYMVSNPATRTALVSTNSITQGEQFAAAWKPLVERFGVAIDFAHRTFRWDSESNSKAHVHCVIVGFSVRASGDSGKLIFDGGKATTVPHINAYLLPAPDVFVESRNKPLCDVPEMVYGNKPTDGGFLFLDENERKQTIVNEPAIELFIHPFLGATEFLNGGKRYCLWLKNASPSILHNSCFIRKRLEQVREFRQNSTKAMTRDSADAPGLFQEIRQPESGKYLLVPRHSSENRSYIPIGFIDASVICGDANLMIPSATLYHFGVLTSSVHNAWMRAVAGRLKSDYRYSAQIVYNNFPWPEANDAQKARIEATAQAILDARAKFPKATLADLYDELAMP